MLDGEIQTLINKGAMMKVHPCTCQFLSQIFLVPKKDGSYRPVINLRPLNRHIEQVNFKMDCLRMMKDLLRQDDWMVLVDLKDAYLSVAIWEDYRKFLRFQWQGSTYEFHVYSLA